VSIQPLPIRSVSSKPHATIGDSHEEIVSGLFISVDGVIESADYDLFRVHAEAGQHLVFDLFARRAGSRLDGTLAILDDRGNELMVVKKLNGAR
jgi:hypothetical protein